MANKENENADISCLLHNVCVCLCVCITQGQYEKTVNKEKNFFSYPEIPNPKTNNDDNDDGDDD